MRGFSNSLVIVSLGLALSMACSTLDLDGLSGGTPTANTESSPSSDSGPSDAAPSTQQVGCAADEDLCDSVCTQLISDPNHCGSCSTKCGMAAACVSSHCVRQRYISPVGDDANPGTTEAPWKTFSHALQQLVPGDALILKDGSYTSSTTGLINASCGVNTRDGTVDLPIAIAAEHERAASVLSDGSSAAISVKSCNHWILDGLVATTTDRTIDAGSSDPISFSTVLIRDSRNITARRLLVSGTNRGYQANGLQLFLTNDALLTENEVYGFHRAGIALWRSSGIVQRCYVHSRDAQDTSAATNEPTRGDVGIEVRETLSGEVIVENSIAEDVDWGLASIAVRDPSTTKFVGSLSLHTKYGLVGAWDGVLGTYGLAVQDFVALDAIDFGIYLNRAVNASIKNASLIRTNGLYFVGSVGSPALPVGNAAASNVLVHASRTGFSVIDPTTSSWTVSSSISSSNIIPFSSSYSPSEPLDDAEGAFRGCEEKTATHVGFEPGSCVVYLPEASNMKRAGANAGDIGANVVYRHEHGAPTKKKLWESGSGRFPCGAIVTNINDLTGKSCRDVHERLNFGADGCPPP